ncbi:unnamed protein product [marine sediment metagenome]|uniref:SCP domain-containing protein n=1 Tax=marine sediment metagenome TaxID=412755 RepID=X0YZV5_9ZZZZ
MLTKLKISTIIFLSFLIAITNLGFFSACKNEVVLDETELAFLNLINDTRIENNLNSLMPGQKLMDTAKSRCEDMMARNYFSHYTPEGKRPRYAEILGRAKPISYGTPENFLDAWSNSQSHKEVILNPNYKKIGIAIVDNNNIRIVTIIFSKK